MRGFGKRTFKDWPVNRGKSALRLNLLPVDHMAGFRSLQRSNANALTSDSDFGPACRPQVRQDGPDGEGGI